jgi:hypothetical protein
LLVPRIVAEVFSNKRVDCLFSKQAGSACLETPPRRRRRRKEEGKKKHVERSFF